MRRVLGSPAHQPQGARSPSELRQQLKTGRDRDPTGLLWDQREGSRRRSTRRWRRLTRIAAQNKSRCNSWREEERGQELRTQPELGDREGREVGGPYKPRSWSYKPRSGSYKPRSGSYKTRSWSCERRSWSWKPKTATNKTRSGSYKTRSWCCETRFSSRETRSGSWKKTTAANNTRSWPYKTRSWSWKKTTAANKTRSYRDSQRIFTVFPRRSRPSTAPDPPGRR